MHRQIPCHPFGPGTFPFGQQRECPLYRSEYRQHTQQDLLTVYGRPLANAMKIKENKNKEMNYIY